MRSRSTRVRSKVVALLASLVALWAFAAYVTLQDGTNLLSLTMLDSKIGRPSEALTAALQAERRLSLVYLGDRASSQRTALIEQRKLTDQARDTFEAGTRDTTVGWFASVDLAARFAEVLRQVDDLRATRDAVDSGTTDRNRALASYTEPIDAIFRTYGSLVTLDDETIAKFGRTLVKLSRATELLSQEDALLAGSLAAGQLTVPEHTRFVQLVGAQRFLYAEAVSELPVVDQARYQELIGGQAFGRFQTIEDQVAANIANGSPPNLTANAWNSAVEPVFSAIREVILKTTDHGLALAKPVAIGVIVRLALAGGLGLIAVIASIIISITTARNLVRQLERLRNAARDLASYRLPRVVERLQHGERVDVDAEAPPLDFGRDEIGQVGEAFNQVQETAIRVAVEQAELRRSVRDVFLSLARRSQALLHRQLGLLDAMERRATDSEELAELFRIDHLATRMRRNAENLIVLSGATAGRAWRKPVAMVDVLRGALAEVEDYTRVTVLPVGSASLLGRAVGDVIHLLAELIENAVSFSPPQTVVRVGGSVVGYGFAIEIEDRGLGMSPEELESANEQLRNPPEFRLTSTARLGLYVVGKLAERHGIKVRLTESPYGGTTAIVLLPGTLMADDGNSEDNPGRVEVEPLEDGRSVQLAGAGRHRLEVEAAAVSTDPAPLASRYGAAGADRAAIDQAGTDITAAATNGSHNGHGTNGFAPATPTPAPMPALTPVTPVGGTPALTPNGLPTRSVPSQPTGPSTMDSAAAPLVTPTAPTAPTAEATGVEPPTGAIAAPRLTPAGLPWRQRPSSPAEAPPVGTPPVGTPPVTPPPVTPPAAAPTATVPTIPTLPTGGPTNPTGWSAVVPADAVPSADATPPRGLDQTRSLLASYRSGTLRGRTDAARLTERGPDAPQRTEAPGTEPGGPTPGAAEHPAAPTPTSEWTQSTSDPRTTEKEG